MKAIRIYEFGAAETLKLEEIEKPRAKAGEVLIKVAAAGVNYADTMMRAGNYLTRPELPFTPGFEAAGTIDEIGAEVSNLQVGQRVLTWLSGGGYAEYVAAEAASVIPIPDELGFGEATALLVQGLTALGLLNETRAGQTILIHAAAGGVGSLLVQLAKHKGLKVIGTASNEQKLELVTKLGADVGVNYTESDWTDEVLRATEGKGADWIIEMVGGEIVGQNLKVLSTNGTMWIYGAASGEDYRLSALSLMQKNHIVRGYWLRNETTENRLAFTRELLGHIRDGRLQIQVTEFPLEQAAEAHKAIEGRKTTGKVVLTV
ncbi:MAG TPA: zinc-binding dehydrogenase [Pyrinomonadaceae bacterium]|nr:zinc-binding dehydrogenase [Pyrinomonadaceae bacterium]